MENQKFYQLVENLIYAANTNPFNEEMEFDKDKGDFILGLLGLCVEMKKVEHQSSDSKIVYMGEKEEAKGEVVISENEELRNGWDDDVWEEKDSRVEVDKKEVKTIPVYDWGPHGDPKLRGSWA